MDDFQESIMLWLPSYMVEDEEAVTNVTIANGLVMDLIDGDATLEEVYDNLSDIGVDLNGYTKNLEIALEAQRKHKILR